MKKRLELKKLTLANLGHSLQGNLHGGARLTWSCEDDECQTRNGCTDTRNTQCGQNTCISCTCITFCPCITRPPLCI
ncbi:MAG: hypothetical protein JW774_04590 [Candidatus Aureabacteria bacterium]|nr:hypothetical protein [Candidatus Auribacterota bacterium]